MLLAEDDCRLGNLLQTMLSKENFQVDWVQSGDIAYDYATHSQYDIILLDWMLPVESGLSVCKRIRDNGYQGGIIMLTAKDAVEDRVAGLDAGADDYIVKPFEFRELLARIRAVDRRSDVKLKEEVITSGDLILDKAERTVKRADREIQLTSREFQLLSLLLQNHGRVVPRDAIINRIWGLGSEVSSNNLDAHIRLLRRKIELPGEPTLIHNVRGLGYKLED